MIEISSILEVEQYIDDVDAVIFDLDDTLYSEKEYVRSGYQKIAEHFNRPRMEEQLWQIFLRGGKAIDEVLALHGLTEKKEAALRIYREQMPDIHLYDGVLEMICRIRKSKKVCMITDGRSYGQRAKIQALRLNEAMDRIIITDELGGIEFRKPNPAAFQMIHDVLDVAFERMIYIGDNPQKDFIAPVRLGMKTLYFRNADGLYTK